MTKSHISVVNAPVRVVVPINDKRPVKLETFQKRGRPIGVKDKNPHKTKAASLRESPEEKPPKEKDFSQRAITNNET